MIATIGLVDIGSPPRVTQTFLLPYGLAWLRIGLLLVIRGAPTIIDLPPALTQPHPIDLETPA